MQFNPNRSSLADHALAAARVARQSGSAVISLEDWQLTKGQIPKDMAAQERKALCALSISDEVVRHVAKTMKETSGPPSHTGAGRFIRQ